jgi:hypothetical protein
MKFKYLYIVLIPSVLVLLFLSAFKGISSQDDQGHNDKIIKFSHKLHTDNGVACEDCHTMVPTSTKLSDRLLPNHDNCANCHDVEDEKNCSTCHYEDINEPLIQQKPDNIYFNHSLHVGQNKIKCQTCHKGIGQVDYAFQAKQTNPVMEDCYSCHSNTKIAPNYCESCHISTANLLPVSHRVPSWRESHRFAANSINANCAMCHDNTSCQECHVSTTMITENNSKNNFFKPYEPNNFVDGTKQQKITRVHVLGYQFTHGIDAKGKTDECRTCHNIETFCAKCHQGNDGDFSLGGIEPASHLEPNFVTIGVGSGGGIHAIMARRDMETCVACHDVQGADPTCITCHLDSDGIKGTNPRTHPAGYMHDTYGDWHTSNASVCFTCHTSSSPSSPAGVGFCGYCHGSNGR